MEDASYRRAPPSPDRFSPLRDGEAPGTIDHDGFVKSICVSLEKKIAETTREQRTLQLAQNQKMVAKVSELVNLKTELRQERNENAALRERLCEICLQLDEVACAKEAGEQERSMTEQELERSRRMLRNTWESQNARAATLQDTAFELEQELGALRVQYAAAVASLQVIDHERLSLTSRNAVMQRDMADLIHKHSQLSAFCERLKQNNAALQSSYHAGLQEHPQEERMHMMKVEAELPASEGTPEPRTRSAGNPARLDSLREKLVTSIGALVSGLHRSNSSLAKVHDAEEEEQGPPAEGALQGDQSGCEQKGSRSFRKLPRSPFIKAKFSQRRATTKTPATEGHAKQGSPRKDPGSQLSSPRREFLPMQPQVSGSPLGRKARKMASSLALLGRKTSAPPPATVTVACEPPSYDLADTIAEPSRFKSPTKMRMPFQSTPFPVLDELNETWSPGKGWDRTGRDPKLMRGPTGIPAGNTNPLLGVHNLSRRVASSILAQVMTFKKVFQATKDGQHMAYHIQQDRSSCLVLPGRPWLKLLPLDGKGCKAGPEPLLATFGKSAKRNKISTERVALKEEWNAVAPYALTDTPWRRAQRRIRFAMCLERSHVFWPQASLLAWLPSSGIIGPTADTQLGLGNLQVTAPSRSSVLVGHKKSHCWSLDKGQVGVQNH
ncbi:hypothetical protein WJX84_009604 [Apatococcus fuscideae]|uniref:Uncharacterized protein n=1 Tax=Apatococcus fuscideae TaxID=2026836 RepID=A0AAW1T5Z0_9CHLO